MAAQDDRVIRKEVVATALDRNKHAFKLPPPDGVVQSYRAPAMGWKLGTIRAWNPAIGERCATILDALDNMPKPAA